MLPAESNPEHTQRHWLTKYLFDKIDGNYEVGDARNQSEVVHQQRLASIDYILAHNFKKLTGGGSKKRRVNVELTNRIDTVYYHQLMAYRTFHTQMLRDHHNSKPQTKKYLKQLKKVKLTHRIKYLTPEKIIFMLLDNKRPDFYIEFFANPQQIELNYNQPTLLADMDQNLRLYRDELQTSLYELQNGLSVAGDSVHMRMKKHKAYFPYLVHLINLTEGLLDSHQMAVWANYRTS